MKWTKLILSVVFFTLSNQAISAETIEGVWKDNEGESKIQISKCGSHFCNKIIWLKTARKDINNEDKSLRNRDLVGVQISNNLKPAGKNRWEGSVYSPKKGKTYSGFATVSGNKLTMKGCLTSAGVLCQKVHFTRDQ